MQNYFDKIEDPRIERSKLHSLNSIFSLTVIAAICGIKSWEKIAMFGRLLRNVMRKIINLQKIFFTGHATIFQSIQFSPARKPYGGHILPPVSIIKLYHLQILDHQFFDPYFSGILLG